MKNSGNKVFVLYVIVSLLLSLALIKSGLKTQPVIFWSLIGTYVLVTITIHFSRNWLLKKKIGKVYQNAGVITIGENSVVLELEHMSETQGLLGLTFGLAGWILFTVVPTLWPWGLPTFLVGCWYYHYAEKNRRLSIQAAKATSKAHL